MTLPDSRPAALGLILLALVTLPGCVPATPTSMGVAGPVVDESTGPVSDCTVLASGLDDQLVPETAAVTDDNGKFRWTLPAIGGYLLTANCSSGLKGSIKVEITTDRPVQDATILVDS
jgi:hypothetical protein